MTALYIHWPFCVAKCPYCDFNSHVRAQVDEDAWQRALIADLRHEASVLPGRTLGAIFFGGGTPSLMPPRIVAALIDEAARLFDFAPDIEITLEANPNSVEAARFAALVSTGVNRLSLGLQALDDDALKMLGRAHDVAEGLAALDVAQAHARRVSFDLIYARPGQTLGEWEAELARALSFGTEHLSLYQLTIEPGTRFATDLREGRLVPLEEDAAADLFDLNAAMTAAAGLPAYEISNHARPGAESRHNLTYWRYGDYIGIGPGAHGRRLHLASERHRKPENWLEAVDRNGHGLVRETPLDASTRAMEALLMGLRLREGVDLARIAALSGIDQDALVDAGKVAHLVELGLVVQKGAHLGVTPKGMPLLDAILPQVVAINSSC